MLSIIYKFNLCLIVALCIRESWDFAVHDVLPSPYIAFLAMVITILLLIERLYILLWMEQKYRTNKK
jgi:hypothetical protein